MNYNNQTTDACTNRERGGPETGLQLTFLQCMCATHTHTHTHRHMSFEKKVIHQNKNQLYPSYTKQYMMTMQPGNNNQICDVTSSQNRWLVHTESENAVQFITITFHQQTWCLLYSGFVQKDFGTRRFHYQITLVFANKQMTNYY